MKIIEKIVEPEKVKIGSIFKLKIKVIKFLSYKELKTENYQYYTQFRYIGLKGA